MEDPPDIYDDDESTEADLGEDHRGDQPGYDLDEQAAIEDLERERGDAE